MSLETDFTPFGLAFAVGLLVAIPLLLEAGRRYGKRRVTRDPGAAQEGFSVMEGAVFSLLGLLIAFTFSGAAGRFDDRRKLIIEEANNIGTAWLRVDLLPANAQPPVRDLFREYLDSRLATYRNVSDLTVAMAELAHTQKLQRDIWQAATRGAAESGNPPAQMLLLPALNTMFDIVTTRTEMSKAHPPAVIFAMLAILTLAASLLAGYSLGCHRSRSWLHLMVFTIVLATTVHVIIDLEFPRFGFVRIDAADSVLVDLRASMK